MEDQPERLKHEQGLDRAYYAHLPFVLASSSALQAKLEIYNSTPYALPPLPPRSLPSTIINNNNDAAAAQFPTTPTSPTRDLNLYDRLQQWSTLLPQTSSTTPLRALSFHDLTPSMHNPGVHQNLLLAHLEVGVKCVTELSVGTVAIPPEFVVDGAQNGSGEGVRMRTGEEEKRKTEMGEWIWFVIRWDEVMVKEKVGKQGKMVCFAIPQREISRLAEKTETIINKNGGQSSPYPYPDPYPPLPRFFAHNPIFHS